MKKSLLSLATVLMSLGAFAQTESQTTKFSSIADTWIRENNKTWNSGGSAKTIELNSQEVKENVDGVDVVVGYTYFVGLYGFEYNLPEGTKVQKATLHLVTERVKGGEVSLYGYTNDFAENTNWNNEETYIETARTSEPVVVFTAAGQWNKAIFNEGLEESKLNLDAWTNDIDVTNYIKSVPVSARRVNFLLQERGGQVCFYSKETTGQEKAFENTDAQTDIDAELLYPYLEVTFVEDAAQSTDVILPVADTQIRKGNTANNSAKVDMELKLTSGGDEFYGLMRFEIPAEVLDTKSYELNGASLRLVCTQNKGDRAMGIYDYAHDFAENTTFAAEEEYVRAAIAEGIDPIVSFSAAGAGSFSMGDTKVYNSDYFTAEAWSSHLDLTDYIAEKIESGARSFNILIKKQNNHNDAMKFATKEAVDIEHKETAEGDVVATFKAEDLVPQLTVTYTKKDIDTGVDEVTADNANAPVEFFNLQGVRVENPTNGLYIKRQGNTVTKVLVR